MILLNELDLEKSFNKLKASLNESNKLLDGMPTLKDYMQGYVNLALAVNRHLDECNSPDPDDIKDIKFN